MSEKVSNSINKRYTKYMTMASLNKNILGSDDEDDLELLRLAALKSLKQKNAPETQCKPFINSKQQQQHSYKSSTFGAAQTTRHHNRGFRNNSGRLGRNGINARPRINSNLISIQTVDQSETKDIQDIPIEIPKLILPQDRYHKPNNLENTTRENTGNKFDRYDNSDDSESDSDELGLKPSKRERKNSLELLMDDLENEINLLDNKTEPKANKKEEKKQEELIIPKPEPELVQIEVKKSKSRSPYKKSRSRSRTPPRKTRYSISPLAINTEVLNTITMAPLSPRSAAFVLENRQILARRQMSPRRSLSRESSPRRRSRTPRRNSLSPRKRSNSPRISPRRRSTSPRNNHRRRSPINRQPIHRRLGSRSNSKNVSPLSKRKRASRSISLSLSPSPDRNYHKRPLNETTGHVIGEIRNRRDKPRKEDEQKTKTEEKILDPILEARKRKFENSLQVGNNGIIKLKVSKSDEDSQTKEEIENSPVVEELEESEEVLDLNPTLDDLWTDEDSNSENEGRFKSKTSLQSQNITILPFRKLTEKSIPKTLSLKEVNDHRTDRKERRPRRRRSRSPQKLKSDRDRIESKCKPKSNVEKVRPKPVEDEKKEDKNENVPKSPEVQKIVQRKVKIQKVTENDDSPEIIIDHEDETVTNKSDDGDLRAELSRRRAQRLFKAGSIADALPTRLLKTALQEVVPKRSTIKQSKITKGNSSSANRRVLILKRLASNPVPQFEPATKVMNKESKLPIHMRLGSTPDIQLSDDAVRSERRKRPRSNRRKKQAVQV